MQLFRVLRSMAIKQELYQWLLGTVVLMAFGAARAFAVPAPPALSPQELLVKEIEARVAVMQLAEESARNNSRDLTQAVSTFYTQRQFRPVWNQAGRLDELIAALDALSEDGLSPEDYQVSQLRQVPPLAADSSPESIARQADDDIRATNAYLRALYHLFNGKVDPAGLDPQWNFELEDLTLTSAGIFVAGGVDITPVAEIFAKTRPQHPLYNYMREGLKRYRVIAAQGGWPSLPVGPSLKPCMVDPQVAILRKRLSVTGEYVAPVLPVAEGQQNTLPAQKCLGPDTKFIATASASSAPAGADSATDIYVGDVMSIGSSSSSSAATPAGINPDEVFDEYLVEAVKKFQRDQYLDVDGAIGPATRAALNVSVQSRIDQIRVNLDRARWLLHNIPADMVLVDVAGFKITYFKAHQPIWRSRVQVGMAYRTSPIFKSEVNYITLNPTWTVPPTILRKDILPKVRKDINYLREHNIRVLNNEGKELDPHSVDWARPGNVILRQDAGADAALGKAVIRFPNSYSVYLHDTPHQKLFDKSQRAFSSGCIRVERALELVELLLAETPGWDQAAINQALDTGKTRNVTLAKRVPILLAYWTVDAIDEHHIAFKPDIYARDAKVLVALNRIN
ncbi:L,D-transpeptidase family protein [Cellvibrio mixtus]|uniref:L,D-transpeptidase family protein n=1 Tax=Cellvibrio mixtus TaxID=39650 RepID=UPI000693455C|nr:L,D-transpeptidase family protein [Cellvibrio mixtus]